MHQLEDVFIRYPVFKVQAATPVNVSSQVTHSVAGKPHCTCACVTGAFDLRQAAVPVNVSSQVTHSAAGNGKPQFLWMRGTSTRIRLPARRAVHAPV